MNRTGLISHINEHFNLGVIGIDGVSGGDINMAFKLSSPESYYFVKVNRAAFAADMFEKESFGLKVLDSTQAIKCPVVIGTGSFSNYSYLILEWIESGRAIESFWRDFGRALASLHRTTNEYFGLDHDNYIGSLVQINHPKRNFIQFFSEWRLQSQFSLAYDSGLFDKSDFNSFQQLINKLEGLIPKEPPALIHGDLWSGNFLCDDTNKPCLIDPACYYGHRESDLAMTRLFGGFHPHFYEAYNEFFELEPGHEERIPLFQLYYLLVHVNLFGKSYVSASRSIFHTYT